MEQKLSLPSIGILFDQSWAIYKSHFKTLILISLFPIAVTVLFGLVAGAGFYAFDSDSFSKDSIEINITAIALLSIFIIVMVASYILSGLAIVYSLKDDSGVFASFRSAFKKFWSYLWLSILSTLIILGGFVLFVIPGIIFSIWFVFALYVTVAENKGAFESILKSKEYVSGYWWPVFGRIVLLGLIFAAIGWLAQVFGAEAAGVINWIVQIFLSPFAVVYAYSLYRQFAVLKPQVASSPAAPQKGLFIFFWALGLALLIVMLIFLQDISEFFRSLETKIPNQ